MTTGDDFYHDRKWCEGCGQYVPYLRALDSCYCVECRRRVRLFSENDRRLFQAELRGMTRGFELRDEPSDRESA